MAIGLRIILLHRKSWKPAIVLGMLVMDENRVLADTSDILSQVESMVLRDRNHPSVIIWSLCNEEMAHQGTERGERAARAMRDVIRQYDPTRPNNRSNETMDSEQV